MKQLFAVVAVVVALASATAPSAAHKHKPHPQSTLIQAPTSGANAPKGYYLMQGNRILSPAYPNVSACYKDLANLKKTLTPGAETVVCVHRQP